MINSNSKTQLVVINLVYRAFASIMTIGSFIFFQYIGTEYLNLGLYAGWIGFFSAIITLTIIRFSLGSFKPKVMEIKKLYAPVEENSASINSIRSESPFEENAEENFSSRMPLPTFDFTTPSTNLGSSGRTDFNLETARTPQHPSPTPVATAQNRKEKENNSTETSILRDIKLIELKLEKLEGIKHAIDPRVYKALKRQYTIEKEVLQNHFEEVQAQLENLSQNSLAEESVTEESETGNESIEDELLQRFEKLDNLIATRLKRMKTKSTSNIIENTESNQKSEPTTTIAEV